MKGTLLRHAIYASGLVAAATSSVPVYAQAADIMRTPNRSVSGDWWCIRGTARQDTYTCMLKNDTMFKIGPRSERADRFLGLGGVWCSADAEVKLHSSGYLNYCSIAQGHTLTNLQRRDGSFARKSSGQFIMFDDDGFFQD